MLVLIDSRKENVIINACGGCGGSSNDRTVE